ncbi:hypothetical protein [Pectobacterium versatile]|uniref:hypothetical protein n=1 Tax=Pectobacterium versatile TaxID=2488639 RepID=UPI00102EEA1E|nr:hypothetical protein [Pectobacterium versatile]TAI81875.1 hypothetical protein EG333_18635 [Pectobacterium versatile]
MTDKTGLFVVPAFLMRLWGWRALNLFGPFPEPAFLFRKPHSSAGASINVNWLINEELAILMLKM